MSDNKPLVSIGMPVYNGERFIHQALGSLLAQDYDNFELIISDNASTDRTAEICQRYAVKDKRIRYYRNKDNLGAAKNFHRVFELSSGKYFMCAAHDDIWSPTYISKCVDLLERETTAVLCCTYVQFIDHNNNKFPPYIEYNFETIGLGLHGRIKALMHNCGTGTATYGLIRRETLEKTQFDLLIVGSDWILLFELSLLGAFVRVPEPLFFYRQFINKRENDLRQMFYWVSGMSNAKIPPYPFTGFYLYSQLYVELFKVAFSWRTGFWNKLLLLFEVAVLFFPHWHRSIYHEHKMIFYDCHEQKNLFGVRRAVFFCLLLNPASLFNYDFLCIAIESFLGTGMYRFLRKIKNSVKLNKAL